MERFFKTPTVLQFVERIYMQVIQVHETGGMSCTYYIPTNVSSEFIDDLIFRLNDLLLDADVIDYKNNVIMIDWS